MLTDNKKIKLGQFFTKEALWLKSQVKEFILQSNCKIAYDPFAGAGDLLNVCKNSLDFKQVIGLDIDSSLSWELNDSLLCIPHIDKAIIITNPPYIAKQSASRKKIDLSKYFDKSVYNDLYLIALDKMLDAQDYIVAIIPESFINSSYKRKSRLSSITILEENPFEDTENPVCVACFDKEEKEFHEVKIYKNDTLVNDLETIEKVRLKPTNKPNITFNALNGWLGIRAVDSTNDKTFIKFDFKENIPYDWEHKIKGSSRHFTLIEIEMQEEEKEKFIAECNRILAEVREKSADVLLTPFMGNTKKGIRRRRLDFRLARAIMEKAYNTIRGVKQYEQHRLF